MNQSVWLIRTLLVLLSILFFTTYTTTADPDGATWNTIALGVGYGTLFALAFIGIDFFMQQFDLRAFNIAIIGLLLGYVMGQVITWVLSAALDFTALTHSSATFTLIKTAIFLVTTYLAMIATARAADEIHLCIPFIKLEQTHFSKQDIVADRSALSDPRIIDLASSGLLDGHLIVPNYLLKETHSHTDSSDEGYQQTAYKRLEIIKRLEALPYLSLRYTDKDFPEAKDPVNRLAQVARTHNARILTAETSRIQDSSLEGTRTINIHDLANALKPLTQTGESINIKVQRYGKEARQGVGYLEDGTMVVINGGAEYIGETISAQVLSVKHTSSGRMIFCNANEEEDEEEYLPGITDSSSRANDYFVKR